MIHASGRIRSVDSAMKYVLIGCIDFPSLLHSERDIGIEHCV